MSPPAHQLLRAGGVQDDPGLQRGGHGKGDAAGDVCLHEAGDDVSGGPLGGDDQVDARGAAHLGHPADGLLHLLGGHQHQVRQLVDDHHHAGQGLQVLAGLCQPVILLQLLHALLGEGLVPLHHLVHRPLEGAGGLLRVRHHPGSAGGGCRCRGPAPPFWGPP